MGIAYALGRGWAKLTPGGKLLLLAAAASALAIGTVPLASRKPSADPVATVPVPATAPAVSAASAAEATAAARRQACERQAPGQQAAYDKHMAAGRYWQAAGEIRPCAGVLGSPGLAALLKDAQVKAYLADINNQKAAPRDRASAMQILAREYPDVGGKYAAQAEKLIASTERQEAAAAARLKRSQGVQIGMSKDDVLASSWGRPSSINTTTTARGTREQWVYGGRNYLYFENGTLTAIQN
jgi:hypothetical protein